MARIVAAPTDDLLKYQSQAYQGTIVTGGPATWNQVLTHFKVGEGGWKLESGSRVQRAPTRDLRRVDNTVQDIDAIVDTTRLPIDQRYVAAERGNFEKAFVPGDVTWTGPAEVRCRCFLDFGEFNNDGSGNFPEIWEVAVFGAHPTIGGQKLMMGYATFLSGVVKNPGVQFEKFVYLVLR